MFKTVAAMKLAMTLALAPFGVTPAWCDFCGEMYQDTQLKTHVFEEYHEYDHGFEVEAYTMDVCPWCVDLFEAEDEA